MQAQESLTAARKLRVACLLFATFFTLGAQAQQIQGAIPMRDMLTRYIAMLGAQCPQSAAQIKSLEDAGKTNEAKLNGMIHQLMCVCHPEKARGLLKSLPETQLSKPVETSEAFNEVAVPGIMEPCHGEQMHDIFLGDDCLGFLSTDLKPGTVSKNYCGCMRPEIAKFSDHEITAFLQEIMAKLPAIKAAKANKQPLPELSPLLKRYTGALNRCGGGQEFAGP